MQKVVIFILSLLLVISSLALTPAQADCPTYVTRSLCQKIFDQGIDATVRLGGVLEGCSMSEASKILKKCIELTK